MRDGRPTRVIIDTDPGVDDALAILLALRSPELEIVAITTVCGNVPVGQATRNLFRALQLEKPHAELMIGQGAARPLEVPLVNATDFHGADGVGDLGRFEDSGGRLRYPEPALPGSLPTAQEVWRQCVRRYPGELTLITLGPLTNLALGLKVDPTTIAKLRNVICMGGAIAVPGNVSPAAEFNMYADPHAAQRVIESGLPVTLVPLDVTTHVSLNRKALRNLTARTSDPVCRFVGDATGPALRFAEDVEGHGLFYLHDPLAVGAVIDPSLLTLTPLHMEVVTSGHGVRGMTLADRRVLKPQHRAAPNAHVALRVNGEKFLRLFRERVCRK
ncbi:MAG: nucleoside hydrolase [Nitrospiraceae bacterium]